MIKVDKIQQSFSKLEDWVVTNGWAGFDPYDIKGKKWFVWLQKWGSKSRIGEITREIVVEGMLHFPLFTRKIFGVQKKVNAKAQGLFASSFYDLYVHTKDKKYLKLAESCKVWLLENGLETKNDGFGWGYPFDWQSTQFIPAGTPNGIVTTAVGEAFWKRYKIFKEKEDLETCKKIARFLMTLPRSSFKETICFSYTDVFINHVHNLNLFVAEFLIKTGLETENQEWVETGLSAVDYTLNDQNSDGTFDYNGPPEKPMGLVDNYHTCFVMRMLQSIYHLTNDKKILSKLEKCYKHYIDNFFHKDCIPKFTPDRLYRIDIHSSAEAIQCLALLEKDFPGSMNKANKIAIWTIDNLQDSTGYFYHGIFKNRIFGGAFKSKIPYIRWGQAWMLRAFATYLTAIKIYN